MSDPIQLAIAKLQAKLLDQERAVAKTKMVINELCEIEGLPLLYELEEKQTQGTTNLAIRSDQFYGQPLAAAIRAILELRRKLDKGPATVNEIYAALIEGGFAFDTRNEDNAKRGLRISLSKNSVTFHRLPNGKFGLLEWYPAAKTKRPAKNGSGADEEDLSGDATPDENEEQDQTERPTEATEGEDN